MKICTVFKLSKQGNVRILFTSLFLFLILTGNFAQPLPGWERPGACNTGPTDESILVPSGTIKAQTEGEVIENVFVTGVIYIYADNITIRNFKIDADANYWGIRIYNDATGLVIEDGEIYNFKASSVGSAKNYTARRLNIHDSEGDGFAAGINTTIESCYVHHIGTAESAHADGVQIMSGSNIHIQGNYLSSLGDGTGMNAPDPYQFHAGVIVQCDFGPVDSVWIINNWLDNGSYTINGGEKALGSPTNIFIHNNHFGGNPEYNYIRSEEWFKDTLNNVFDPMGTSTMPECGWSLPIPVTGISLSSNELNMTVDETDTLTATIQPSDAEVQDVIWSSTVNSVASVDTGGTVTALQSGETIIIATSLDGDFKDSCTVIVEESTFSPNNINNKNILNIYPNPLSGTEIHLTFSESLKEPAHVEIISLCGEIVYTSLIEMDVTHKKIDLKEQTNSGIYILRISNNAETILKKIIIE